MASAPAYTHVIRVWTQNRSERDIACAEHHPAGERCGPTKLSHRPTPACRTASGRGGVPGGVLRAAALSRVGPPRIHNELCSAGWAPSGRARRSCIRELRRHKPSDMFTEYAIHRGPPVRAPMGIALWAALRFLHVLAGYRVTPPDDPGPQENIAPG